MVVSNHLRPPEYVLEATAAAIRSKGRMSLSFQAKLDEHERRFGDFEACLKRLTFVSADSAFLLQPQKDGTYQPVVRNIYPGQLATALERGFLVLALEDYESAIETKTQERMNSGERGETPQVESQAPRKPRPFKCEMCGTSLTTKRRLNSHLEKKHGGS